MRRWLSAGLMFVFFLRGLPTAISQFPFPEPNMTVVKPLDSDAVLRNPGIGFTTFQRFEGDPLNPGTTWTEGFPPVHGQNPVTEGQDGNYPPSTVAYLRLYWRFVEPVRGQFDWEVIDKALHMARSHGQTLMLRIAPYGTDDASDVPAWYRAETGEKLDKARPRGDWTSTRAKWMVDPEKEAYARFFGSFVRKLGERYDGNPEIEAVDLSIVGAWGESAGVELLRDETRLKLIRSYTESFRRTPLLLQPSDKKTVRETLAMARPAQGSGMASRPPMGWRADCLGDMGGFSLNVNTMTDFYPEAIVNDGLAEQWKTAPVSMEACWVMQHWKDNGWNLQYIMDQSIKWHMSSFNAKSSAVPPEWKPQVDWWLRHMGYRFVLRRFAFTTVVDRSRVLSYRSWWENKGNAPTYRRYVPAVRISTRDAVSAIVLLEGDPRRWLPGDSVADGRVRLPETLRDGEYMVDVALVDPVTSRPAIQLAIQGTAADGWFPLGKMRVDAGER